MNTHEFQAIIDFAVAREQEAVTFYNELKQKAAFEAQKEMLQELEDMEKGHIVVFENIRTKGVKEEDVKTVKDLKISDYLIAPDKDQKNLTYPDIILLAMKKEEAAYNLYLKLADEVSDTGLKTVFQKLASEEANHKLRFEKIYDEEILKEN